MERRLAAILAADVFGMAAGIPNARFVELEGKNHVFQEHEPASARFFEELKLFLNE